jgi:regulator of protease activity HflC (stomatin/prohibitin superfamily)
MINVTIGRLLGFLGVLAIAIGLFASAERVPMGYTGVIVNMMGSEKGVQAVEEGTGWKFLTPSQELYKFPTFDQNENLGIITFQDVDGMEITADIGITIKAAPGAAPMLFQTYRKSMYEIIKTNVPQVVKTELNNASSKLTAENIYGKNKEEFFKDVESRIRTAFGKKGLLVTNIYINGKIGLPPKVVDALNAKIESTQKTAQRENEVAQVKAEADKEREKAKGEKDAAISRAQGEAESITIRGKALRDNPGVVELNAIEKWDGKLPSTMLPGSAVPFVPVK